MNGGEIHGNTANQGHGGGVMSWGTFAMKDGKIFNNNAGGDGGGVVFGGAFTMYDGEITIPAKATVVVE